MAVGAVGAVALYAGGWLLEDVDYWLAEEAVALWVVALPAWLFAVALAWRAPWGAWLPGLAAAIGFFAAHLLNRVPAEIQTTDGPEQKLDANEEAEPAVGFADPTYAHK